MTPKQHARRRGGPMVWESEFAQYGVKRFVKTTQEQVMNPEGLKLCPFCGPNGDLSVTDLDECGADVDDETERAAVGCHTCDAHGPVVDLGCHDPDEHGPRGPALVAGAAEAWNHREGKP